MIATRVVGLGQPAAGDDGVGVAVVRQLRAQGWDAAELVEARDGSALIEWMSGAEHVVLVDAVVRPGEPGEIVQLAEDDLGGEARAVSSHAMSVPQAVGLARTLGGADLCRRFDVVGVTIRPPTGPAFGLSPAIEASVGAAISAVKAVVSRGVPSHA